MNITKKILNRDKSNCILSKQITKTCLFIFTVIFVFSNVSQVHAKTWVNGYYRKDGTYVSGYYRGSGSSSTSSSSSTSNSITIPDTDFDFDFNTVDEISAAVDEALSSSYSKNNSTSNSSSNTSNSYPLNTNNNTKIVNLYKGTSFVKSEKASKLVFVRGYFRSDGTYVRPHYKTSANHTEKDNFSYLGISSLMSKKSYSNFNFNSDENIGNIQRYLLYSYDNTSTNLSSEQQNNLIDYSVALNGNSITEKRSKGEKYYKSIGYSDFSTKLNIDYDINGIMTYELYILKNLESYYADSGSLKNNYFSNDYLPEIESSLIFYAYLLQQYSENELDKESIEFFGNNFYDKFTFMTLNKESQIEMDLLQKLKLDCEVFSKK